MKIVKLFLDEENILAGLDAVALVENPAIEEDFYAFSNQNFAETFNDYPKAAIAAAKRGIELNKENGNKCATQVGKVRAQQLANGEPVSLDTIRRIRAFLIRHKDNFEKAQREKNYTACSYISYLLWGGEAALPWAEKKLRQAGEEFKSFSHEEMETMVLEAIVKDYLFSQVDSIDGVPVYSSPEEAETKAKEIGCEGYHEHTTPEGLKVYMPCSHHGTALETLQDNVQREFNADVSDLPNYVDELPDEEQEAILRELESKGISREALLEDGWIEITAEEAIKEAFATIKSTPDDSSIADFGQIAVRYRYDGPRDSRNRDFCGKVMDMALVYRREDINNLSVMGANEEFGIYDVFRYKGSYNCRHRWQEVFYKRDSDITNDKKPLAISQRILDGTTINNPVIQKDGVADKQVFAAYEDLDEKQIVVGPLMTPNKLIKRIDADNQEYFVYFDEDTIEKLAYKFMEDKLVDKVNIEHNSGKMVEDAYLVESWIVKDPENDKSLFYGYAPKKGQWFGMYKIKNKDVWDKYVRTGKVRGFSVEGWFNDKMISYATT